MDETDVASARETREQAGQGEGCLGKAADDEPVFVLRASDSIAPILVELWADLAHQSGHRDEKVAGAAQIAEDMRAWAAANSGHKQPD